MHHVHISTEALFVSALFIFGLVAVTLAFVRSIRKDRLEAQSWVLYGTPGKRRGTPMTEADAREWEELERIKPARTFRYSDSGGSSYSDRPHTVTRSVPAVGGGGVSPVAAAAPTFVHGSDPVMPFVTGMLLGESMGHHHDTTVIHDTPAYADHAFGSGGGSGWSGSSDSNCGGGVDVGGGSFDSGSSCGGGGADFSF